MIREIIEKCSKKQDVLSPDAKVHGIKDKKETDGGYGDLGVIPSAPSKLGKEKMIVDGEVDCKNNPENCKEDV